MMAAPPFDTIRISHLLRDRGHFTAEQSEDLAVVLGEAFQDQLATKTDLKLMEQRITIRLGGMMAAGFGLQFAALKIFNHV